MTTKQALLFSMTLRLMSGARGILSILKVLKAEKGSSKLDYYNAEQFVQRSMVWSYLFASDYLPHIVCQWACKDCSTRHWYHQHHCGQNWLCCLGAVTQLNFNLSLSIFVLKTFTSSISSNMMLFQNTNSFYCLLFICICCCYLYWV